MLQNCQAEEAASASAAWFWLPQAAILGALLLARARPAIVAGAALSATAYLAAYAIWLHMVPDRSGLAWIGYLLYGMPGLAIAALVAAIRYRGVELSWSVALLGAAVLGVPGAGAGHALCCTTVMYCGF